ncbi:hypothetical protein [Dictyobacter formicarum]|uniref:Uncharacterized protein n=1 Tax=Dictyobacter formicarum TaxID=2778368 RepID=A0ABQ3VA56_9CHLR|nr:hypothetical protein [Dictyobacter formicarum]GHO82659.1 hypothetical protein KSZ_06650 [Dictyobacter formicarum]
MHDYIFHHQHTLTDADVARFAEAVDLERLPYARDMSRQRGFDRIEEDV